jgi:hypothetical protein
VEMMFAEERVDLFGGLLATFEFFFHTVLLTLIQSVALCIYCLMTAGGFDSRSVVLSLKMYWSLWSISDCLLYKAVTFWCQTKKCSFLLIV